MSKPSDSLRSFIALDIPADMQTRLMALANGLRKEPYLHGLRWIPADNWHLTLTFLGDQNQETLANLWQQVERALHDCSPVALQVNHIAGFPDAKSPVLAAQLNPLPELLKLQAQIKHCCELLDIALDKRRFKPHITLARSRKRHPVHYAGEKLAMTARGAVVGLYTSELTPTGSIYRIFRSLTLSGPVNHQGTPE